jgi:rod shape determining protein RodA
MMIDRRLIIRFDWPLVGMVILIACIGILNLYSITSNGEASGTPLYLKQVFWLIIGLAIMMVIAFIEYRFYSDFAYIFYAVVLVTLLIVLAFGVVTSGAQRWIKIGSLSFQPSEFAKIALILILAKLFQRPPKREGFSLRELLLPFLLLLLPVALILKQPDLGTSIILVLIFVSVLLFVKVRWSSWLIMIVAVLSVLPLLWSVLKDYQKKESSPSSILISTPRAGYHVIQSKIAVGPGYFRERVHERDSVQAGLLT